MGFRSLKLPKSLLGTSMHGMLSTVRWRQLAAASVPHVDTIQAHRLLHNPLLMFLCH